MRRGLDRLLPGLVLVGALAAAIVVNLLLSSAQDRSLDALEESVQGEVEAIARSQNQGFEAQLSGTSGLFQGNEFELTVGSEHDLAELNELLELFGAALRGGFYLLDLDGTVTTGVLLLDDDTIGQKLERPGYDELAASPTFAQGRGGLLSLSDGLTTHEPVLTFVVPINAPGPEPAIRGPLRGSFVFESVVAEDSQFNQEIKELHRGDTGRYIVYDANGSVIASNDSGLIAEPVDNERLLTAEPGLYRRDGRLEVIAAMPSVGWRIAFRQDIDEFEDPLAGPLESTGLILILALLAAGSVLTLLLVRRLRAARAEQERLEQLNAAQQEFISIVSHELRTPVAGVLGFLETSIDHWDAMDDSARRNAVERAASNAKRLQAMTRDVLDTQTMESGRLVHVFERLDLAAEVRSAIAAALELDPDRSIQAEVPEVAVPVDGDADRLHQVLANLLDNARKNSSVVEPIEVSLVVADGEAHVTVRDHGAGIADESAERIFDKFVRGRGESVSGTGLGLYISRQIVHAHGGRIWAESAPDGAVFHFALPLANGSDSKLS